MNSRDNALSTQSLVDHLSSVSLRDDLPPLEKLAAAQATALVEARLARERSPVLELSPAATASEVANHRRTRAVRRGKDVFLPAWQDLTTAIPNLLLRSSLWTVRKIQHASLAEVAEASQSPELANEQVDADFIATLGDSRVINRGPALGSYDRRVFAACLDYYREDRPLNRGGSASHIEVSFYKFITAQNLNYHADSHRALRASLERLSAMSLHVRHDGLELQLPRILEVSFADGEARGDKAKASDLIYFRVLEKFANLYGGAKWTAVPHSALNAGDGLKSWLASFYATHSKPFQLPLTQVHALSGTKATLPKFKAQLKEALEAMKSESLPIEVRVKHYDLDKKSVTVQMASWG